MRTWAEIPSKYLSNYDECPDCRGPKARHAKACQRCSPHIMRGENHYAWKGAGARSETKRSRVANVKLQGPCEDCGAPGRDRHHKDALRVDLRTSRA